MTEILKQVLEECKIFKRVMEALVIGQGNESDEWGTNYAGHFLLEAQHRGYIVSESMLQQWKIFERNKASCMDANNS